MPNNQITGRFTEAALKKKRFNFQPGLQRRELPVDKKTKAQFDARAAIFKALAHPSRLFIVERLAEGEYCVQELTEMVDADISTISKHLSVLRNAGIVEDRKEGTRVYYKLAMTCVLNFFSCVETVMMTKARKQVELLE